MSRDITGQVVKPASRYYEDLEPEVGHDQWAEDDALLAVVEERPTGTAAKHAAELIASIRPTSTADSLGLAAMIEGLGEDDLRGVLIDRIVATVYAIAERSGGDPKTRAAATRRRLAKETDHALAVALRRRLDTLLGLLRPVGLS